MFDHFKFQSETKNPRLFLKKNYSSGNTLNHDSTHQGLGHPSAQILYFWPSWDFTKRDVLPAFFRLTSHELRFENNFFASIESGHTHKEKILSLLHFQMYTYEFLNQSQEQYNVQSTRYTKLSPWPLQVNPRPLS